MRFYGQRSRSAFDIVDWNPGYDPDIMTATVEQQSTYNQIKYTINSGKYVDVSDNDAYLYYYITDLTRTFTAAFYAGRMSQWRRLCENFINLYSETKPKVVSYLDCWLFVTKFIQQRPLSEVLSMIENQIAFRERNSLGYATDLTVAMYVSLCQIKASDYIDPIKYFKPFCGSNLNALMTDVGKQYSASILENAYKILNDDYHNNGVNFLYRLYDFKPGGIAIHRSGAIACEKSSALANCGAAMTVSGFRIPQPKAPDYRVFLKTLIREAENCFRKSKGLSKVSEGWISETLLFRRIASAFPEVKVLQHASPSFLGRQHYDVYLPEYKIAIEYQGEQHFAPVEFFGGEDGLNSVKERDAKKIALSRDNHVTLFWVMPNYNISDLIKQIYKHIASLNYGHSNLLGVDESIRRANDRSMQLTDESSTDNCCKVISAYVDKEKSIDTALTKRMESLVNSRPMSKYAKIDVANIKPEKFSMLLKKFEEIKQLSKSDPEKSNRNLYALMDEGYVAPAAYLRLAANYRKLRQPKAELIVLIQGKRDFGYDYDERIKTLIRKLDDTFLS